MARVLLQSWGVMWKVGMSLCLIDLPCRTNVISLHLYVTTSVYRTQTASCSVAEYDLDHS